MNKSSYQPTFSESELDMAYRFMLIEANRKQATKPHTFFQLLKNFLQTIALQDPNRFHFDIARKAIYFFDKSRLQDPNCIDNLARKLVTSCQMLNEQLIMPEWLAKQLKFDQTSLENFYKPTYLMITELPDLDEAIERQLFTKEGLSIWDAAYMNILTTEERPAVLELQQIDKNPNRWDPNFWFRDHDLLTETYFFHSPAFLGLARLLLMRKK